MSFSLNDFKLNLKLGGARSSLFDVSVTFPTETGDNMETKFLISSASIPGSKIGSFDVFHNGVPVAVPGDRTTDTLSTKIINDEDFAIKKRIEKWIYLLNNQDKGNQGVDKISKLKTTVTLAQYGKDGTPIRKYNFIDAFPLSSDDIALSWDTTDIETYSVTWKYQYWTTT